MKDKTQIVPYEQQNIHIYAYSLPQVPSHEGCIKVGETTRNVELRIAEQLRTAGLTPHIYFTRVAQKANKQWFHDKELHRYFVLNNIPKKDFGTGADEWFYFNGTPEKTEELTDKFINLDYDKVQSGDNKYSYVLRYEQELAVKKTIDYYLSEGLNREFLWNAKPRFGKTLTTYDLIRKMKAHKVLIVTNRPAIANSWYDDFQKFIAWQEPEMRFVSDSPELLGKAINRDDFVEELNYNDNRDLACICFISLQDLKGARVFGGIYDKHRWIAELNWDLLVIDEAHEGVDTFKTDKAFSQIKREFTLHLSGTPFKAIANQKFTKEQIYNWSYLDEQKSKNNWDILLGSNPYANLPTLNMFTYQMSKLIRDKVELGYEFEDSNVDYAFDLAEFFRVENDKFVHEDALCQFLDNLASNKFPFSLDKHREELKHTLWLLDRVASAKALEKLLKKHIVFKNYKIILAAGDGRSFDEENNQDIKLQEKSLARVRTAIQENPRTITLSVGQLTTGVTIPEWTGVLMLNNIKSPSLYFQAAFRAQNPYEYVNDKGELMRKENAYVFDFAPERTLVIYDEFANNLIANSAKATSETRKENIRELLNFFPVIAEDENGTLQAINADEVLTIPVRLKSQEVVKRGFMSNLLFANISSIFSAPPELKEILEKIAPEKQGKLATKQEILDTKPMLDDNNEVAIPTEIVINTSKEIFGNKIFVPTPVIDVEPEKSTIDIAKESQELASQITENITSGFDILKETYKLTQKQKDQAIKTFTKDIEYKLEEILEEKNQRIQEATDSYKVQIDIASTEEEKIKVKDDYMDHLQRIEARVHEDMQRRVNDSIADIVEEQLERVEERKKKSTEDEVRDHLRGFARTITAFLMAYGDENTTLANFEVNIDPATFIDLTSISIEEFKKLRDGFDYMDEETGEQKHIPGLFDEVVFDASVQEFFTIKSRLADYFGNTTDEDIFDYIPPQKTNQIFTPRKVVNMMLDTLEENDPGIFQNKHIKFIDLYIKSGLYLTEIAKRLFKGLADSIPFEEERIKWIFEKQLYGFAPSNIIYNISNNFIFGEFDYIRKRNIIECDLVPIVEAGKLEEKIKEVWGENMKFDVVIGNPPYQEMDGGAQSSAKPLYHLFVTESEKLSDRYVSLIIPSRWFAGGKGLDEFRNAMLNSKNLKCIYDFLNPEDLFPNTNIRGGVNYFLIDKNLDNKGQVLLKSIKNKKVISEKERPLKLDGVDFFIRDNIGIEIVSKVYRKGFNNIISLESHISSLKPFGLRGYFINSEDYHKNISDVTEPVLCYGKNKRIGYVNRSLVEKNKEYIGIWKVFTPRANNIGTELNDDNLNTFIGKPGEICTESYIMIGDGLDLNSQSANNLCVYLKTRFARFMHSLAKASQDATAKTYQFVPMQDFTSDSDIDWSRSVDEIDEQLFDKYNLTAEEREHIRSSIKDM